MTQLLKAAHGKGSPIMSRFYYAYVRYSDGVIICPFATRKLLSGFVSKVKKIEGVESVTTKSFPTDSCPLSWTIFRNVAPAIEFVESNLALNLYHGQRRIKFKLEK